MIIASGPLTSPSLSESIARFCGSEHLYFYDAISPIVIAETIDDFEGLPRQPIRQSGRRLHQLPDGPGPSTTRSITR